MIAFYFALIVAAILRVEAVWDPEIAEHSKLHGTGIFELIYVGSTPSSSKETLRIASVETRTMKDTLLRLSTKGDERFQQIGKGEVFRGFRTKMAIANHYLKNVTASNPEQLVLLVDSDVVIAKSCDMDMMIKKYHNIVKKSGGKRIVFGAELNSFDTDRPDEVPQVPRYIASEKPQLIDMEQLKQLADRKYDQDGFIYMNSGTIMGPASMLQEMSRTALDGYLDLFQARHPGDNWKKRLSKYVKTHNNRKPTDQHFYWNYYLDHKDKVTVDFGQELFNVMSFVQVDKVWEVRDDGALYNTFVDEQVCLGHFPGHSKFKYWTFIRESLDALSPPS